MFYNLRKTIHLFFLKRKLKKVNIVHQARTYGQTKKIGVLFDASTSSNIEVTTKFARQLLHEGKTVELLGYLDNDKESKSIPYDYMTRKNISILLKPGHPKVKNFITKNFDILINLFTDENIPFEYISSLSNASYRIGRYQEQKEYCFDLMISYDQTKELKGYVDQVLHFMKAIR